MFTSFIIALIAGVALWIREKSAPSHDVPREFSLVEPATLNRIVASRRQPLSNSGGGVATFVRREIEWMPTVLPPTVIADRVFGTCLYLIQNGLVMRDRDTLGINSKEQIKVRYADRGQRPGIKVLQLTLMTFDAANAQRMRI